MADTSTGSVTAGQTGEVGGENEEIRRAVQWWDGPIEEEIEVIDVLRLFEVGVHLVESFTEGQDHLGVDIERHMEVDRPPAPRFRMEIDFP